MLRRLIIAFLIAVVAVGSIPILVDTASVEVAAQTRKAKRDRPNFFQRLLGVRDQPAKVIKRAISRKKKTSRRPSQPPVVTAEVQPKDPDARKILVVGDFVAGGLAWGLEQTFAEESKLTVIDKSKSDSGLARADRYDWNAVLLDTLNEVQPDVIVLVVGANDRQQLQDGSDRYPMRSNMWVATYTQRITGLIDTLKVYGRPFFWVGAPPMRATAASSDMVYLNGLYKPRVQAGGGHFVDIWNGFTDEDGRYITSGPDVDGQVRQLRTRDGINFTRAGRLKLAFYVERDIRRQTGFGSGGIDLLATVTLGNQIEIAPDGTKLLVGPIISLNDPLPGFSQDLAGADRSSTTSQESVQYKMIVSGEVLPTTAGRVDDFTWPPRNGGILLPVPPPEPEPLAEATVPVPVARPPSVTN